MAFYECVFIARPDISTQQVDGLTEQFSGILAENGGKVAGTEYWGLKNLAYRIKKNRKGHYVMMNLDTPPAALLEMERNMRLNEDIIRMLTIRVDALEEGPSIVMQTKNSRDERVDRGDRGGRGGPRGGRRDFGGDDAPAAKAAPEAAPAENSEGEG